MTRHVGLLLLAASLAAAAPAVAEETPDEPERVTVSGTVVDLSCAARGRATTGRWDNTGRDHRAPDGGSVPSCATMCLKLGQPAGLFADGRITAVFACSAKATLADFAGREVEIRGFWGGAPDDAARTFLPEAIRARGESDWTDVVCAEMHG